MKNEKRQMMEGIELPDQEKIRPLWENKTYKYLGILEADTVQTSGNERKSFKKKRENNLKPNDIAEFSS